MSNIYVGGGKSGAFGDLTVNGEITSPASQVTISSTIGGKSYSYTKTLDASGQAVFKGLLQGTWNISMTDGTQTATDSVTINTNYAKELMYYDKSAIFWEGVGQLQPCEFTQLSQNATGIIDKDKIQVTVSDTGRWYTSAFSTSQPLDLSNYSTLILDAQVDWTGGYNEAVGDYRGRFGVSTSKVVNLSSYSKMQLVTADHTRRLLTLDLTSISNRSNMYIGFSHGIAITIYKIYFA